MKRELGVSMDVLESRRLLAGNVTAVVVDGDLIVTGDAQRNRIVISSRTLAAGEVRVSAGDDVTTINKGFDAILSGVTGSIIVRGRGRADTIDVRDLAADKALRIDGGLGSDLILLNRVSVDGRLEVRGRAGDDEIRALDSVVDGEAEIRGDGGSDRIVLDGCMFNDDAEIRGGDGDDQFSTDTSTFDGEKNLAGDDGEDETVRAVDLEYSFTNRRRGWTPGFADYPKGEDDFHAVHAGLRDAPAELGWDGTGFRLTGDNHSDDLFMYLKRQLGPAEGLKANTEYQVRFTVTFGSNVSRFGGGIGGSPGESVYLRAGASTKEPERFRDTDGRWRMNVDKGDQATGGKDISVVGPIANDATEDEALANPGKYKEVTRTHVHTATVKTDANGRMWVIVGTDSGFEGVTTIYYKSINIRLTEV